jgi:hypothetical protein
MSSKPAGVGKAALFGLEVAALAAAVTAIVLLIKNEKNKNNPVYKKPSWAIVGIAAAAIFAIGFILAMIKQRASAAKSTSPLTSQNEMTEMPSSI